MTKFIAFVSGKGGVGKTTSAINVGQALTNLGKRVLILDGNLVTPNIGIYLGYLNPKATLNNFLRNEKELKDIMYTHESVLSFIPASTSLHEFQKTNIQHLTEIFEHVDETADFVLVDAPSGLGYDVEQLVKLCDEVIIVVTPTLSSAIEALKTAQLTHRHHKIVAGVILNLTNHGWSEMKVSEMESILGQQIIANVKNDWKIRKSLHKQAPVNYLYPRSRVAKQFRIVAEHLSLLHNIK